MIQGKENNSEISSAEHDKMANDAENIFKSLDLLSHTISLCSGDIGFSARIYCDFEVWLSLPTWYLLQVYYPARMFFFLAMWECFLFDSHHQLCESLWRFLTQQDDRATEHFCIEHLSISVKEYTTVARTWRLLITQDYQYIAQYVPRFPTYLIESEMANPTRDLQENRWSQDRHSRWVNRPSILPVSAMLIN